MTLSQFLVLSVIALVAAVPVVRLTPRARSSPTFNLLLWAASVVVGFLIGWLAVAEAMDAHILDTLMAGGTPVVPAVAGALGGELALNLPLWLLDHLEGEGEDLEDEGLEEPTNESDAAGSREQIEDAVPTEKQ